MCKHQMGWGGVGAILTLKMSALKNQLFVADAAKNFGPPSLPRLDPPCVRVRPRPLEKEHVPQTTLVLFQYSTRRAEDHHGD